MNLAKKIGLGILGVSLIANVSYSGIKLAPQKDDSPLTISEKQQLKKKGYIQRKGYCSGLVETEIENIDNKTFVLPAYSADEKGKMITSYLLESVSEVRDWISDSDFNKMAKTIDSFLKSKDEEILLDIPDVPGKDNIDFNGEVFGSFLTNLYNNLDFESSYTDACLKHRESRFGSIQENQIKLKKKKGSC